MFEYSFLKMLTQHLIKLASLQFMAGSAKNTYNATET